MEDGLKDNADKADSKAEISKAGFIFLGVMNFGLVLIGIPFLIGVAKQSPWEMISSFVVANVLFFTTGISCLLVAMKKLYAFLIVELMSVVVSMIACIRMLAMLIFALSFLKQDGLDPVSFVGLLLVTLVQFIVLVTVCVKTSQHIHYCRK